MVLPRKIETNRRTQRTCKSVSWPLWSIISWIDQNGYFGNWNKWSTPISMFSLRWNDSKSFDKTTLGSMSHWKFDFRFYRTLVDWVTVMLVTMLFWWLSPTSVTHIDLIRKLPPLLSCSTAKINNFQDVLLLNLKSLECDITIVIELFSFRIDFSIITHHYCISLSYKCSYVWG